MSDVAKTGREMVKATASIVFKSIFVLLFISGSARAQGPSGTSATDGSTPLGLQPGAPAGSYPLSGFDNINPFNGNLNFHLPLLHIGGRGGAQHTMMLPIEQRWRIIQSDAQPYTYTPTSERWFATEPGYTAGAMVARLTGVGDGNSCASELPALTRLTFTTADGTEYEFHDVAYNGAARTNFFIADPFCRNWQTTNRGKVFVTAGGNAASFISDADISDFIGLGITEDYPSGWVFMSDGTRYRIDMGRVSLIQDRNGNQLTFQYNFHNVKITDSLNRVVNVNNYYNADTTPSHDDIVYTGFGGATRTITVNYDLLEFHCRQGFSKQLLSTLFPGLGAGTSPYGYYDPSVVSSVVLPNGKKYTFYYNSYGELARVVLPTGGAYEYDYEAGVINGDASGLISHIFQKNIYRRVTQKRVYVSGVDGSGNPLDHGGTLEGSTIFSKAESSGGVNAGFTDISHYASNGSTLMGLDRHSYVGSAVSTWDQEPSGYSKWQDGKEWRTEAFETDGATRLQRVTHTWGQPLEGNTWPLGTVETDSSVRENNPQIIDTTMKLYSRVTGDPDQISFQSFNYDKYSNKTDVYEYDFGTIFKRRSHTDYITSNAGSNYDTINASPSLTIHLRSLPSLQWVSSDTAGTVKRAQTSFEYDNYNQTTSDTFHDSLKNEPSITGLDSTYNTSRYTRGNVTRSTRSVIDTGGTITGSINGYARYDIAGNVVKTIDPRSISTNIIATSFEFDDRYGAPDGEAESNTRPTEVPSGFQTYAFATKVISAAAPSSQIAYTQYDYYLGKAVNGEDANGIVAKGSYDDTLDRPKGVDTGIFTNSQIQHHTSFIYDDTAHTITTQSDQVTLNDGVLTSTMLYDGLGRTTETQQPEPGGTIIHNVQQYDGMGRVSRTINPYRSPTGETTNGYADTTYDGAGRVLTVTTSDGAVVTTSYSANATTVADQATGQRRSITDGLGRLSRVDEPNTAGSLGTVASPNQPTSYAYDVLDDLAQVTQGGQIRYFMYDSLKRLIRARNPEQDTNTNLSLSDPLTGNSAWSLKYVYDENSNLLTRTDVRGTLGITTSYVYDALNRVMSRTYTNDPQSTPAVTYKYDGQTLPTGAPSFTRGSSIGRLVAETYGTGSSGNYAGYDQLGRVNVSYQQTDSINYGFGYGYNLASQMTSETYPSGRQVITEYDTAGRAAGIRGAAIYYAGATASDAANRIQYAPQGAVSVMKLGNGKWEHTNFNNRLQPTQIGLGTSSTDSSVMKLDYGYGTTANNGNVMSQIITAPSLTVNQCYGYDSLNRLISAEEKSGGTACAGTQQWKQAFTYDRFGNRNFNLVDTTPNVLGPNQNPTINQSTNRIAAGQNYGYDFAGNLTSDPATSTNGVVYDAENRQTQYTKTGQATNSYYYDGDGHRIKKTDSSGTTVFVYNVGGQLIAEYMAGNPSSGGTSYLTSDHLGSTRVVIKSDGTTTRHDYLPFGEEIQSGIGGRTTGQGYVADSVRQKFTQKERDNESGLDYYGARYYGSAQGRFTSVDPMLESGDPEDPQSWHRYCYAYNNPLKYIDPTGGENEPANQSEEEKKKARTIKFEVLGQVKILGKNVAVYVATGQSKEYRDTVLKNAQAVAGVISANAKSLTATDKQMIGNITAIAAVGQGVQPGDRFYAEGIKGVDSSRLSNEGVDLGTGTFLTTQITSARADVFASQIGHEGKHVGDYKQSLGAYAARFGTEWTDARSDLNERRAIRYQLGLYRMLSGSNARSPDSYDKYLRDRVKTPHRPPWLNK